MSAGATFGALFWVRLVLVAIWIGVPVLLVGALVWWLPLVGALLIRRVTGLPLGPDAAASLPPA